MVFPSISRFLKQIRYEQIPQRAVKRVSRVADICKKLLLVLVILFFVCVLLMVVAAVYRPLPSNLTATKKDRITAQIIEPFTRMFYYYPSHFFCPDALCSLHWTRRAMSRMNRFAALGYHGQSERLLMETTQWDGVKVRVYHPWNRSVAESDGAIVFIHGGGFGMGNTEMYESLTREMAEQMSTRLFVSVDYRLAPETVFPGGLEDCERVLEYVITNGPEKYGVDPNKIVIMGDSAGGNLATVITQRRRKRGVEPRILGQVLAYPLLQLSDMQSYSYHNWKRDMEGLAFLDPLTVAFYYLWYAGVDVNTHPEYAEAATRNGHVSQLARKTSEKYMNYSLLPQLFRDSNESEAVSSMRPIKELADHMEPFLTNPDFAPLMQSNLTDLPPALVITMEFDVLRDEGIIYAERLKKAGVPTQLTHFAHGFHGMLNLHTRLEIARDAIDVIKHWTMKLLREAQII